eukprot:CAMPEP_0185813708 /NCGR_PEP_ID=MMETSP1322-20130828/12234_1 /TAXON_ID=265543 /ORGANISM="Minutocellus polymorphus, Strain RCC2270" /LENGTH=384 /DNA_ID=CAMNT_0028510399 /DNA_START=216 /DNA_END=1370 /DNA_ORIENTATION=-
MAGLSFAAALIGAKSSSMEKDVVATANFTVPIATPSSEGTKDERPSSAPSASQSVEPATSTSTTKQQESQKNENQNNRIGNEKKSVWKKPDADIQTRVEDGSSNENSRSEAQEQKQENQKREGNAGEHKNKKGGTSSDDGKQKKYAGNKPKQQRGGAQAANQQQKEKKSKQVIGCKDGEKNGNQNANNGKKLKKKSAKSNKKKKNNNNKGRKQRKNMYPQPTPLSPAELEQLKVALVCQVEYFFSDDELCRNTFLRKHMDCEGFAPAAMIFNFPSIAAYCFHYYDLLTTLSEKSSFLEIDQVNETLRRRDDYRKWLHPNGEGGFGCPRWIMQAEDATPNEPNDENIMATTDKLAADAAAADDVSSSGSNGTKDTESCTDSENLE